MDAFLERSMFLNTTQFRTSSTHITVVLTLKQRRPNVMDVQTSKQCHVFNTGRRNFVGTSLCQIVFIFSIFLKNLSNFLLLKTLFKTQYRTWIMETSVCLDNSNVRNVDAVGWVEMRGKISPSNARHVRLTSCHILWRHYKFMMILMTKVILRWPTQSTCVENAKLSGTVADKFKEIIVTRSCQ